MCQFLPSCPSPSACCQVPLLPRCPLPCCLLPSARAIRAGLELLFSSALKTSRINLVNSPFLKFSNSSRHSNPCLLPNNSHLFSLEISLGFGCLNFKSLLEIKSKTKMSILPLLYATFGPQCLLEMPPHLKISP